MLVVCHCAVRKVLGELKFNVSSESHLVVDILQKHLFYTLTVLALITSERRMVSGLCWLGYQCLLTLESLLKTLC